jgi:hypothetical protein
MSCVWRRREEPCIDRDVTTVFKMLAGIQDNTEEILRILQEDEDGKDEPEEAE